MAANRDKLVSVFRKITGYAEEDIWGVNENAYTVTTSNGGKYQVSRDGQKVRVLSGPDYPKSVPATEVVEEE